MDEVKRLYFEDLKEKNALVRSARSAARLKYSKGGRQYTKKEMEAMNGPTYTINLREPITWDKFKDLPKDLQKTYLDNIFKQFKIGPSSLARMFGISNQYCGKHMRALGYTFSTRASRKDEERFEAAYCVQKKETAATSAASVNTSSGIQLTTVTLTGAFSAEGVAAALAKLFAEGQNVTITASISN